MLFFKEREIRLDRIDQRTALKLLTKATSLQSENAFPVIHGLGERLSTVPDKFQLVGFRVGSPVVQILANVNEHALDVFQRHALPVRQLRGLVAIRTPEITKFGNLDNEANLHTRVAGPFLMQTSFAARAQLSTFKGPQCFLNLGDDDAVIAEARALLIPDWSDLYPPFLGPAKDVEFQGWNE